MANETNAKAAEPTDKSVTKFLLLESLCPKKKKKQTEKKTTTKKKKVKKANNIRCTGGKMLDGHPGES